MESSETWRTKALKSFAISKSGMQGGEAKRNLPWSNFWWQSCQPLLEHFLESKLCILCVVSKLRKSEIQCFKWCTIQSWNEGVTAVGSRTPQAESQLRSAAKSAFCCEVISQPFLCVCEISQTSFSPAKWSLVLPDICDRHIEIFFFRFLLSKSQNSPCKPAIVGFFSYYVRKKGKYPCNNYYWNFHINSSREPVLRRTMTLL